MEELFNLRPIYENTKCYYGKAVVKVQGTKRTLYSYQDPVAEYDTATDQMKLLWDYARDGNEMPVTTQRHLVEFARQRNYLFDAAGRTFKKI